MAVHLGSDLIDGDVVGFFRPHHVGAGGKDVTRAVAAEFPTAGVVESETAQGSMDALPEVENEWGTETYTCAGAYRAMGDLRQYLTRYGNVGSIDYADRNRRVSSRLSSAEEGSADFMSSAFALNVLNGFIDELPQQVSEYLTALADCDRANGFTPVTRFR